MPLRVIKYNPNYIPMLVDPSLRQWRQPHRSKIIVDDTHAMMNQETCDQIQEVPVKYHSICMPGKMFKYKGKLIWFGHHTDITKVSIHYRTIIIVN